MLCGPVETTELVLHREAIHKFREVPLYVTQMHKDGFNPHSYIMTFNLYIYGLLCYRVYMHLLIEIQTDKQTDRHMYLTNCNLVGLSCLASSATLRAVSSRRAISSE